MANKLKELTDAQIKRMKDFAKERVAIQLNTVSTPETEKEAEYNLRMAYKVAGLDGDNLKIVWVDSPIKGVEYLHGASVRASVGDSVRASVGASVGESVGASVRDSVRASVWASVGDSVWDSVLASVGDSVWASVWAYYWADDLAFYGFFNEILEPNNLRWLDRTIQLVSGYHLYSKEAILVRKPALLTLDESGKLHNEVQKCIEYRDGWGFYAWHGTKVPENIIKDVVTKDAVLKETNQENKRVLIERIGYETFLSWINSTVLHEWGDYKLIHSKELVDQEELYLLKCKDTSTERVYFLRVPPTVKNCKEAVAWTFSLNENSYSPEKES
jgi:hypothetical protein